MGKHARPACWILSCLVTWSGADGTPMTNAVFTASASSIYDDLIEERYHFPKTYLRQVEEAVGDWIVYYEPRRTTGPHSATGRQAYFAIAHVKKVVQDPVRADHFYAQMTGYMEFDQPVPFRDASGYRESKLRREDSQTNKGAFGRAVRELPRSESKTSCVVASAHSRSLGSGRTPSRRSRPSTSRGPSWRHSRHGRCVTPAFGARCAPFIETPAQSPGCASSTAADARKYRPLTSAPSRRMDRMPSATASPSPAPRTGCSIVA